MSSLRKSAAICCLFCISRSASRTLPRKSSSCLISYPDFSNARKDKTLKRTCTPLFFVIPNRPLVDGKLSPREALIALSRSWTSPSCFIRAFSATPSAEVTFVSSRKASCFKPLRFRSLVFDSSVISSTIRWSCAANWRLAAVDSSHERVAWNKCRLKPLAISQRKYWRYCCFMSVRLRVSWVVFASFWRARR